MVNIFHIKEDPANPSPPEIYNWRIYVLSICAAMGSAMFGYDSAFIGGTLNLPSFRRVFGLQDDQVTDSERAALQAHIVSTFQAGCFFGAILVYYLNERFGRRISLIVAGTVFNIGVILQLVLGGSLGCLYAGRSLTGLGVGSSSLVIPQFISECSPPAIRGGLVGMFEVALQLGTVAGFWINYAVNEAVSSEGNVQWHIPVAIQLVPASLMVIGMFFMIESPRWLMKKGREENAIKSLSWLRNLGEEHDYVRQELDDYRHQLQHEREIVGTGGFASVVKETLSRQIRFRLFLGCALMIFQNTTGINAINYFSPSIFKSIGFTGTSVGLLATGVYGIVKTVSSMICFIVLVDRFGRRPLLLGGTVGCIFTMFYIAAYTNISGSFHKSIETGEKRDAAGYSAIVMIYLYAMSYGFSWNLPWVICAEIFPTKARSLCLVFTTCSQWLGQFIIVYSTPYMLDSITYGAFIFFGSMTTIAYAFIWFFLPETKGIPLEDMDLLWETRGFARMQRRKYEQMRLAEGREGSLNIEGKNEEVFIENKA